MASINTSFWKGIASTRLYQLCGKFSFIFCCICMFLLMGCSTSRHSSYDLNKKIPPDKLKEDLTLLKKIFEANHPSLYWYTSKDSIDTYFNCALESITDSLTEFRFRNKVSWFISTLRCGHTTVRGSKGYINHISKHETDKFPLLLKSWGDSLVVLAYLNRHDSLPFKRGTVITSIEGRRNKELIDSLSTFISTDGYANNFKNQAISFNFPLYYNFAFPLKDSFRVSYIDTTGLEAEANVRLYKPAKDTSEPLFPTTLKRPTRKERKTIELLNKRNIVYDTAYRLAYMRIGTFSGNKLRSFFKTSFTELKNRNIPDLIIDLRENTGGNIGNSTALTRYLVDKPFHVADTVAAINRSLTYGKYIRSSLFYRLLMRFTTRKEPDDKFHFTALENREYKPYQNLHYNGNIYLVQGGYTFSAAALFVLNLKGQYNVTVVGEETGGGDYGTSAVQLPTVVLPNSKLQVTLPLFRVVVNREQLKDGRGVQPDITVLPSSVAIKKGVDIKLQKVRELIGQQTGKIK